MSRDKYTVKAGGEALRATASGYYKDARIHKGDKFFAAEGETFGWALPADIALEDAPAAEGLLDKPVRDILPALKGATDAALRALRDEEAGGGNRKSILNAIDDELANRVDPLA